MKKLVVALLMVFLLSACSAYTCPTYSKTEKVKNTI